MSVGDLLNELLLIQVPLLDAIVSGTTEQYISLDGQAFDTVIVRGLKVVGWANGARYTVAQLEHLHIVVLGASHHEVMLV